VPQGLPFFSGYILEHLNIESLIGHHPLQTRILILKVLKPVRIVDLHAAIFLTPRIKAAVAYAVLTLKLLNRYACLSLLEDADDLFLGKSLSFHSESPSGFLAHEDSSWRWHRKTISGHPQRQYNFFFVPTQSGRLHMPMTNALLNPFHDTDEGRL
jgi:hypothetical protein